MTFEKYGFPLLGTKVFPTRNYSKEQIPDLSGKIAVVTGGTSGIGLESAIRLADRGAEVIILGSSNTRGQNAIKTIHAKTGKTVRWVYINLNSIKASQKAAEEIKKMVQRVDILIANAGIASSFTLSEDGYETIFACNHLGHFAFIVPLIPLFKGQDVRVVIVASAAHYTVKAIPYDMLVNKPPSTSKTFGDLIGDVQRRYNVSKLANIMFAKALQRRVEDNVSVNSIHPGCIKTSIQDAFEPGFASLGMLARPMSAFMNWFFVYVGLGIPDGAMTQLYCATSPDIIKNKYKGEYFAPIAVRDLPSTVSMDTDKQEELWAWSERAVKL